MPKETGSAIHLKSEAEWDRREAVALIKYFVDRPGHADKLKSVSGQDWGRFEENMGNVHLNSTGEPLWVQEKQNIKNDQSNGRNGQEENFETKSH